MVVGTIAAAAFEPWLVGHIRKAQRFRIIGRHVDGDRGVVAFIAYPEVIKLLERNHPQTGNIRGGR